MTTDRSVFPDLERECSECLGVPGIYQDCRKCGGSGAEEVSS